MMAPAIIAHPTGKVSGRIQLPTSKSLSNRALILNFLSKNPFVVQGLSQADDTQLLQQHLLTIQQKTNTAVGCTLDCQNAGTVFRFLTTLLATTPGTWVLTGSPRMKERPVGILAEALIELGATIQYLEKPGYPPLRITGKKIVGGLVSMHAGVSSQFISSLLLAAPTFAKGLTLNLSGKVSSRPYIDMTLALLERFGVKSLHMADTIQINPQHLSAEEYDVEADWSSAAFIYEAAALASELDLVIEGLQQKSLQGDAILPELFQALGVQTSFVDEGVHLKKAGQPVNYFNYDFTDQPDLAQPLIVACAGLGIQGRFAGLESLRIKETDRLSALESELNKLGYGCRVEEGAVFVLEGTSLAQPVSLKTEPPVIKTYGDHRMAMAFAPLALRFPALTIDDQKVVSKSFPHYWDELTGAGFKIG